MIKRSTCLLLLSVELIASDFPYGKPQNEVPIDDSIRYEILSPARISYFQALESLKNNYDQELVRLLRDNTDSIVIGELEPQALKSSKGEIDTFYVTSTSRHFKVSKWTIIRQEDELFNDLLESFYFDLTNHDGSSGAFSHRPSYGLRLLSNGEIIYETTISIEADNFYAVYPDGEVLRGMNRLPVALKATLSGEALNGSNVEFKHPNL
jgi:hypothetical protein